MQSYCARFTYRRRDNVEGDRKLRGPGQVRCGSQGRTQRVQARGGRAHVAVAQPGLAGQHAAHAHFAARPSPLTSGHRLREGASVSSFRLVSQARVCRAYLVAAPIPPLRQAVQAVHALQLNEL